MKEEVAQESLGSSEENGSMYSLLVNFFQEEITKNRSYVLANELAKVKGEAFEMPERSTKYGVFVDNQGTGSVYSLLCTQQGTPREIFSQVERLKHLRLDVPQVTLLAYELQKSGLKLPDGILTAQELTEELKKLCTGSKTGASDNRQMPVK